MTDLFFEGVSEFSLLPVYVMETDVTHICSIIFMYVYVN